MTIPLRHGFAETTNFDLASSDGLMKAVERARLGHQQGSGPLV